jgi:hypothetical protein
MHHEVELAVVGAKEVARVFPVEEFDAGDVMANILLAEAPALELTVFDHQHPHRHPQIWKL